MLKKLICEQPKEWDRFLVPLLFALRDGVHEEYADIFSDVPGKTSLAEHEIKLISDNPTPHHTIYRRRLIKRLIQCWIMESSKDLIQHMLHH